MPKSSHSVPRFSSIMLQPESVGHRPEDWAAYVFIYAPYIKLLEDILFLGSRYVVSLGAHDPHLWFIGDRDGTQKLTVERALNCCALLSYASDSPVVATPGPRLNRNAVDMAIFSKTFEGTIFRNLEDYTDSIRALADSVPLQTPIHPAYWLTRRLGRQRPGWRRCLHYPWPPTEAVFRAISAYALALLSPVGPSRLLNFWRAIEAVTTIDDRAKMFRDLESQRISPIWTEAEGPTLPLRKLDAARLLRRESIRRRDDLVAEHGGPQAALNAIYWEGRGKAAHADRTTLEFDMAGFVANQLRDAEFLRYMARVAIERAW